MADKKPTRSSNLKFPQAAELQRTMLEAYHRLQEGHVKYNQALTVAVDTGMSSDGKSTLKEDGHAYADAVTQYTNAVMEWLAFVDAQNENAIKSLRKIATASK